MATRHTIEVAKSWRKGDRDVYVMVLMTLGSLYSVDLNIKRAESLLYGEI